MNRKLPACSHLSWGKVWPGHVAAIFDHLVEVGIHGNIWVGTLPCTGAQPLSFLLSRPIFNTGLSVAMVTQRENLPQ